MVEYISNMEKKIVNHVQKAQRVLNRIIPRRNMPRHILIKVIKIKHREQILEAAKENETNNIQGNPQKLNS